jgi:PRTRC genetic system ThiF family protein
MIAPDILISCVDTAKARRELAAGFDKLRVTAPRYWLDLGNSQLDGQVVLGQPVECELNRITTGTMAPDEFVRKGPHGKVTPLQARLPVVTELFPEILNSRKRESNTPTCSVADALARQSLFINDHLTTWAAQILDDLLRIGELRWHGAFVNLESGRVNPIPVPSPVPREAVA